MEQVSKEKTGWFYGCRNYVAGKSVKSTIWWDEGRIKEKRKTQSYENARRWSCPPGDRSWSNLTVWGEDQLAYKGSNDWHYGPAPLPLEEGHNPKGKHVNCLIFNWLKVYKKKCDTSIWYFKVISQKLTGLQIVAHYIDLSHFEKYFED